MSAIGRAKPSPAESCTTNTPGRRTEPSPRPGARRNRQDDDFTATSYAREQHITIQACPGSVSERPCTITPLYRLSRAELPLSFLDLESQGSQYAQPRLFSAYLEDLETDKHREGNRPGPAVLIASLEADKCLYAVEKVSAGAYSLSRLGHWVRPEHFKRSSIADLGHWLSTFTGGPSLQTDSEGPWWQLARRGETTSPSLGSRKSPMAKLTMKSSAAGITTECIRGDAAPRKTTAPSDSGLEPRVQEPTALSSAHDVCEQLVSHYLDNLYLSKTGLAYFVKGPLSRARAAFTADQEVSMQVIDLVLFLRSMLLSHKSMDKKYREKLPAIVNDIPLTGLTDDEMGKPVKKRKVKKIIPGKDGIYSWEKEYVRKWWLSETQSRLPEQSPAALLKSRIADLRIRETLMQVILVLEILSLESSASYKAAKIRREHEHASDNGDPDVASNDDPKRKNKKAKKTEDLKVTLDLLVDKLCIWQSVEQEDFGLTPVKPAVGNNAQASDTNASKTVNGDRLKNFCVEVIVPFYVNRLPDLAISINRQLGGPSASASTGSKRKPGESELRHDPLKKQKRRLERVATDVTKQTSHKQTPLTRSATDSAIIPGMKREPSEVPLASIPLRRSPSVAPSVVSNRSSMSQYKRFAQREIDLTAMANATQAKAKRRMEVEEELQQAISTLKKPHRDRVSREYVESVEQRSQSTAKNPRKPPTTRKVPQTVQVTATPKRTRKTKDVIEATPNRMRTLGADSAPPLSSDSVIPSSTVRPGPSAIPNSIARPSFTNPPRFNAIEETPTRAKKTVSFFPDINSTAPLSEPSVPRGPLFSTRLTQSRTQRDASPPAEFRLPALPQTPSKNRRSSDHNVRPGALFATTTKPKSIFATPTKPRAACLDAGGNNPEDQVVGATPMKGVPASPGKTAVHLEHDVNEEAGKRSPDLPGNNEQDISIYDALGWD